MTRSGQETFEQQRKDRGLVRGGVKLVRKVHLTTLQNKSDDLHIGLIDTLKSRLELILNFISRIQRGTWGLELLWQKLNTGVG